MANPFAEFFEKYFEPLSESHGFVSKVEELSRKAGLKKFPKVLVRNAVPFLNAVGDEDIAENTFMKWAVGVTPFFGNKMIVGDKFLDKYGAYSDETAAIIVHELSHVKHDRIPALAAATAPLIGIAVAMTALKLYEHHRKNKLKKEEKKQEDKLPGEEGYSHKEEKILERKHPYGWAITTAKYLAAATIGLGVGIATQGLIRHQMEYRADKFSAQIMGSGKPLIDALNHLTADMTNEAQNTANELRANGMEAAADKLIHGSPIRKFIAKLSHPRTEDRIARLEGMQQL